MRVYTLKSVYVCYDSQILTIGIGSKHYNFGVVIHSWGIRIMLIWIHLFIRFKD